MLKLEAELDGVAELIPEERGEDGPSPRAWEVERTVEV
jgi:hypothetical protein